MFENASPTPQPPQPTPPQEPFEIKSALEGGKLKPVNEKGKLEDIFASADKTTPPPSPLSPPFSPPQPLQKGPWLAKKTPPPEVPSEVPAKPSLLFTKKIVIIGIVIGGAILLGLGTYTLIQKFLLPRLKTLPPPREEVTPPQELKESIPPTPEATEGQPKPESSPTEVPPLGETEKPKIPPPPPDTDGDGLTDKEEEALGTNLREADSDFDGLYDREEVKVYKTNPLNPDTDQDGYLDGEEVKNGYDPKGPGKLFELP